MSVLRFEDQRTDRPRPRGIDVLCGLRHFAIITYAVPAERFRDRFPERFRLDSVSINGREMGLLSVVPFKDEYFKSAVFPSPSFTMRQTNYRVYVIDTQTGERCVWFLGTVLNSWTYIIPRYCWRLPWHPGSIQFQCDLDPDTNLYHRYRMRTRSKWGEASLDLSQVADTELTFPGFPDTETALVTLTHPLTGYYYRRDGRLGSYRIWHDRLDVKPANVRSAWFKRLAELHLVDAEEQLLPYSVLLLPFTEFTIYLPPKRVGYSKQ